MKIVCPLWLIWTIIWHRISWKNVNHLSNTQHCLALVLNICFSLTSQSLRGFSHILCWHDIDSTADLLDAARLHMLTQVVLISTSVIHSTRLEKKNESMAH